jgi:hypothetical protein
LVAALAATPAGGQPPALIERNRRDRMFGVGGRVGYRRASRSGAWLGLARPGRNGWL